MGEKNCDVVISGIAGIFPDCENLDEFETKLLNMENLISMENEKWEPGFLNVPTGIGKFKTSLALDNKYFGIHNKLYENLDEMTGLCLKCSFEAICDAGLNPFSLSGSDTSVIMASSISEAECEIVSTEELGFIMLGNGRCMESNRISYFFNFKGPSFVINGSWTGGLQALEEAYQLISSGRSSAALVGAVNVLYGPEIGYHFQSMGRLNNDGKTKSFSADADGWTRSEACVVLFLQRAEDAKRSYGNILNVLTINYGARLTPYTDFDPDAYKDLLRRVYNKAKLDPVEVSYIEADGSAIKIQDALELNSISDVFCTNRTTPLAVGSVKSNVGHTEAASSLLSIVKVLMAFKSGFISPNLHYTSPNPDVPALLSGQMEVITAPTPLNGTIVGVSTVGLCGSYGHAIIKQNRSSKNHLKSISSIPMLFIISGRREVALESVIENIESMPFNEDFIALTHNVFKTNIKGHLFRGYSILNGGTQKVHEIKPYEEAENRPIWFLCSGMGSQWPGMGADLMRLPIFARAINLCHEVLLPKGINLLEIINSTDPDIYDSILNSFIGIAAIQIGLLDVLKQLGIKPDGIIGHSAGELGCAYADGCFTAEQMILSAYARGKSSLEAPLVKGMMAAIGLGYNQIKDQLPPTIEIACHNSKTSCTLSGPAEDMKQYVDGLHKKGIFAKLVNVGNIAYHSRYIKPAAHLLLRYLRQVIPEPQKRTKRWISSSVPESSWDSDPAKFSSPEYHTNNLLNPVLFEEASTHIPDRAIVIEIAPRGLLQAIVKKSLTKCSHIPLVDRFEKDTLVHLFKAIGRLYLEGIKINIENLYPKPEFPVCGIIPSVGPLLTWDGKVRSFKTHKLIYGVLCAAKTGETSLNIFDRQLEKYIGQNICGRKIIQSTALLWTVIDIFKKLSESFDAQRHFILIENVRIQKLLDVEANSNAEINFQFQRGSGEFEINLDLAILVSGRMSFIDFETNNQFESVTPVLTEKNLAEMYHNEIYEYFERFSIEFNDNYKLIQKISFNLNELFATIQWKGDLVEFLDAVFMVLSLYDILIDNELKIVHSIRQICVNTAHFEYLDYKEISMFYNRYTKDVSCEGLKIHLPLTEFCNISPKIPKLTMETCQFLPYLNSYKDKNLGDITDCLQIIFQNILGFKDNPKRLTVISYQDNANLLNTLFSYCNACNHQVDIVTSPTEDTMDDLYINFQKRDNLFIIGEPHFYKRMFKCLKKVTAAFIFLKDQSHFEKLNEIYPLIKIKLNGELFILYKMCHQKIFEINTITMHCNNYWKSELKTLLKNETSKKNSLEILYLVSNIKSLTNIYKTVKFCRRLENNEIIRFVFLDDKSPPFSPNQSFYEKQIILDLVMNIHINGTWGCSNLMTHMFDKYDSIPQNVQPKTFYPLSSIVCENVKLISLGLNLCDITGSPSGQELGVFDYCGVDKNRNFICGIGTLKDKKLIEDKILRWQKPQNWSYEEAASIPLCYSIAYYIIRMKCKGYFLKMDRKARLLVHRGGLLISQAILHVALKMECEVITTYTTVEEKNLIHQLFPNIDEKNIITGKSLPLLKSKNRGVDIIINTTEDYSILKYSLKALRSRGCLFQLNKRLMKEGYTIGMSVFLNEVELAGLSPENLLELPTSTKETIQKEVHIAITEGHIKPLRTITILNDALNVDAVKMLNTPSTGYSRKVVTMMEYNKDETLNKDMFICSGQKTYLIISNENKFWFDLVNWLLCRGAVTIHILLTTQKLAVAPAQRLNSILNNHPSAKILLHSKKILSVSSDMKQFLKKLNDFKIISEIFIVGEEMEEDVNIMDTMLKDTNINCNLVCIGSGGETVCELRNKNNIPGLAISCELQLMKGSIILPELDRIIIKEIKENAVFFLKENVRTIKKGFSQDKLPNDLTELLELNKKSLSKACFVELNASCTLCKHNKEVNPIFVISSLKPKEMDKLTSRLFYPTFEARLPQDVDDIDIMAKQLYENMEQFKFNIYTIITNGWGSTLGLKLIKHLEDDGKIVLLIMLDNTPYCVQNWVSAISQMGDDYFINRYVKLPYKIKKKLSYVSNWNDKLDIALRNYDKHDKEIEEIRKGLNLLRNRLRSIKKCDFNDVFFQGKCFIYRFNDSKQDDIHKFNKHCKRKPVIIKVCNEGNLQNFLDDPEMAKKINRLIPYEYPTADLDCESLGVYERDSLRTWFFETM